MAHFVDEKSSSKLPLVFSGDEAWNSWIEVFNAWEAGELLGDDGSEPGLVPRVPLTNITKTDLVPTLGLRDSDLIELAEEIIGKRVCIKSNSKTKNKLTLPDWCREKKLDRVIMNELLWKLNKTPLPCKDQGWVPYPEEDWKKLALARNFSADLVRNIWTELKKVTEGNEWLMGRANQMNPTTDKSKNGVAPPIFNQVLEQFTQVTVTTASVDADSALYFCKSADTVTDVLHALENSCDRVTCSPDPKMIVLFAYSSSGDPIHVSRADLMALAKRAIVKDAGADEDLVIDDDDDAPRRPEIPIPMLFIGNMKQRDTLTYVWKPDATPWAAHTMFYLPCKRAGFKKSELDASPLVTLSLTYPKTSAEGNLLNVFKKFTGIQKPLEWFQACPDGVVDWNGGLCGVDHSTLQTLLKPTLHSKQVVLINIWGGGNVTEIGLVSFGMVPLPVGRQPIYVFASFLFCLSFFYRLPADI